jgi:arabinogalactan endo-1,4-beta-galactosidase
MKPRFYIFLIPFVLVSCNKPAPYVPPPGNERVTYSADKFVMGADISYANQILDHGGVFQDGGVPVDPYVIFKKYGTNVIRFRLWYNPVWTKEVYGTSGTQLYSDFADVKKGIQLAKAQGMQVCLDFHYSDSWADAGKQVPPAAWKSLTPTALGDSVYNYTLRTLLNLRGAGLLPEYVQPGNEINPGLLLPRGDRWARPDSMVYILNKAISAIRLAGSQGSINPKIIIHIGQPENVLGWFNGLTAKGLTDYDIIGFSYYYNWSTTVLSNLSTLVSEIRTTTGRDVMVMETAYPWTTTGSDTYPDIISVSSLVQGYPATAEGQYKYLHALTQAVITGKGIGVFTWEPDWITSQMKDPWGTGSPWECNTLFDYNGNTITGTLFMTDKYSF